MFPNKHSINYCEYDLLLKKVPEEKQLDSLNMFFRKLFDKIVNEKSKGSIKKVVMRFWKLAALVTFIE